MTSGFYYGTVIDIVPKLTVAVPDWPCSVKCVETEVLLAPLPAPPVVPAQEITPAPNTTTSAKAASPRITTAGRVLLRR